MRLIHVTLALRYALTRLRGWYALALAGRGRGAPPAPDKDARIIEAIRRARSHASE
ncbi:hypothetical protein HWD35_21040 [Tsukamurella tyrosinosolvens]|uniref:hypothetical protein n=1 Tax=Tsukamurella tyrosinosolvens TaxID=57704 RepID=UPI001CE166B1|nr:hypothetical protein [Tsukamurella tyrosinosolvens]MCA4997213.1 hypothetical protein [Tsukamurella tyrosinosolvens]